jgi:hypothetical protein
LVCLKNPCEKSPLQGLSVVQIRALAQSHGLLGAVYRGVKRGEELVLTGRLPVPVRRPVLSLSKVALRSEGF